MPTKHTETDINITSVLTPQGDRSISIIYGDTIIPLLVTKDDLKAYRLFRANTGLEAIGLPLPDNTHHKLEDTR
jgi:hypothetical protein